MAYLSWRAHDCTGGALVITKEIMEKDGAARER
jgi:hypothetical protein